MEDFDIIEWVVYLTIDKEDGFIPVNKVKKIIEDLGGLHKYSALLEVKDGEREYTINTLMTRLQRKKLEEALREVREILRFDFSMV